MLSAVHNVAIYFMTFVSEHYMMLSPNRGVYRADERVESRQLVNCQLTEPKYRKYKTPRDKEWWHDENKCNTGWCVRHIILNEYRNFIILHFKCGFIS